MVLRVIFISTNAHRRLTRAQGLVIVKAASEWVSEGGAGSRFLFILAAKIR